MSSNAPKKEEYQETFDDLQSKMREAGRSPCEQLDDMRMAMVSLQQIKSKTRCAT